MQYVKTCAIRCLRQLITSKGLLLICLSGVVFETALGQTPSALLPIATGNRWSYQITNIGFSPICAPGTFDAVIEQVDHDREDGTTYFTMRSECGYTGELKQIGRQLFSSYQPPIGERQWFVFLDDPADDKVFQGFRSLFRYQRAESVTVPAGTFTDCWRMTQLVGYTHVWTYCSGIGKVHEIHVDLSGTGYEIKLQRFTPN